MPVAVACGAAGAGTGAGAGTDAGTGGDGDPCCVTPPGKDLPGEASRGRSDYVVSLASKSRALV